MNRNSILMAALALLSVGCSDLATKDAPIEDRSALPGGVAASGGVATSGSGSAGIDGKPLGAGVNGGAAPGLEQAAPGVQTHGTISLGVEASPLPGASGALGAEQYAGMRTPPQDPASLLSKRAIYFDYDSATIKDEYRDLIKAHAEFLKAAKDSKSILQGHTDERGSRDYNLALGQRRAESVQQALALLGVDPLKLESVSLGEEKPVRDGHDDSAWAENRRVEIYYQGE
jgi:peptidoglycan-associated lipoprotein